MSKAALHAHLQTGATHVCHCWDLRRKDGVRYGFTDHDRTLGFDGMTFTPSQGLSARALSSTSGLSVNNTEAFGVLSSDAMTETDIVAGRFDGAQVTVWHVCWDDVGARKVLFRGTLGEITRSAGGFQAEMLGLTEALNRPQGRSYLKTCSAVLGDARCGFAVDDPAYRTVLTLSQDSDGQQVALPALPNFAEGWFAHGLLEVLSGPANGLRSPIRNDQPQGQGRRITLWSALALPLAVGDSIRLTAGCDKRPGTCRAKFANFLNFRGFPDIPGDDWLVSVPRRNLSHTGGSRNR